MNSTLHIPKAEIHVHLEATITPSLCRKFAERNKVKLSADIFGSEYAYQWEDFYDFIKRYDIVTSVIQKKKSWSQMIQNCLIRREMAKKKFQRQTFSAAPSC